MKSQECLMINSDKELMKFWDSNNTINPSITQRMTTKKIKLKCPKCGYEWEARARDIIKCKCPCCEENKALQIGVNDIATLFPNISQVLLQELNPSFDIRKNKINSKETVTWICIECGKTWSTQFKSRIRKNNKGYYLSPCPSCSRKKIPIAPSNYNLEVLFPKIANELSNKNNIKANQLFPYSKQEMIWQCSKGHEWKDTIKNRTILGRGCKICAKYKTPFFVAYPHLLKNFDNFNNVDPLKYSKWSKKDEKWTCNKGHKLILRFCDITENNGVIKCKYCDRNAPYQGESSLFDAYPTLRNEWCEIENKLLKLDSSQLFPSSEKIAYWECLNGHKYQLMITKRIDYFNRKKNPCPYCKGLIRKKVKLT